jgi:LmbE family N-acetylglucosaminyl deacetylase
MRSEPSRAGSRSIPVRSIAAGLAFLAPLLLPLIGVAAVDSSSGILPELRSFREMGSVLFVAAHPDDEDSSLIALLARGRYCRTGYLSMTRGDGGQNVLGPEIGDELGAIRTQELLAARRADGGQQFFTRAKDFGYSKDYRETLKFWGEQEVLSDAVRVIREFRPDVLVAGFSTNQTPGQHGHHVSSAILAAEAFRLAGDPKAFPEQGLKPWQPKRLLQNRGGSLQMQISSEIGTIAGRSRSMHKTQGFGDFGGRGGGSAGFTFQNGEPATRDIFDGVDTTWARVQGGAEIGTLAGEVIDHFNPTNIAESVPALLKIHHLLAGLPADSVLDEKRALLNHILQECLGLNVQTTIEQGDVVPGEELHLRTTAIVESEIPVTWIGVRPAGNTTLDTSRKTQLRRGQASTRRDDNWKLPAETSLTMPYWLRQEGTVGRFRVDDASLIGRAENPPPYPLENLFEVGGEQISIETEPMMVNGDSSRALWVIPPVSLRVVDDVQLFPPGAARQTLVEVTAARDNSTGSLKLKAPSGWRVSPESQPFSLRKSGEKARFTFTITAPPQVGTAEITAVADVGGRSWDRGHVELRYDHIPAQLLQPPARLKALTLDLSVRARKVGYIPGAGDLIAEALSRMGCAVTQLTSNDFAPEKLSGFDTVVIGIRAFNVHPELSSHIADLSTYATNGGTVIVLYNRPTQRAGTAMRLAPYRLNVSSERVTDETAEMTLLVPEHPVFNTPNKIVASDFEGWVQERGAYFASDWDEHFTPLIACHDPGEGPLKGSLLVAQYGKGYFVYTALSWFRQLPDGVPGAYRLFANLISLGR